MITLASVLNTLLYSNILVLVIWLATKNARSIQAIGVSTLLITMFLILIRAFFPVELPITYAFNSDTILPFVNRILKEPAFSSLSILQLLLMIIGLGVVIRLFFITRNYYHIKKSIAHIKANDEIKVQDALAKLITERPLPKRLNVISSCITSVPIVLGYRNPVIILPDSNFTAEETYYILRHELQHIYNGDLWKKLILELLTCLYWWFPVISIAFRRMFTAILEYQADLSATKSFAEGDRIRYLECVLRVSKASKKQPYLPLPLGMSGNKHFDNKLLTKRFLLVLDRDVQTKRSLRIAGILLSGFLLLTSFLFVIQPYHSEPLEPDGSIRLTADNAYIIENGDSTYDIYLNDGTFLITVSYIDYTLADLPRKRR